MAAEHRILPREDWALWQAFVEEHPEGSVFHQCRWLERVGEKLRIDVLEDKGRILAGVATVERRKFGVGGCHVPPYTPRYGPLIRPSAKNQRGSSRTEEQGLLAALLDALPAWPHTDFILAPGHHDPLPFHWRGWQPSLVITHQIGGSEEEYTGNIVKRKAAYLRKLRRQVDEGRLAVEMNHDADPVLGLWEETAEHKDFGHNDAILRNLFSDPTEDFWTCVTVRDQKGELLGASLLAYDSRRAYNLVNGVRRDLEGDLRQVNMLLMDAGIRWCLESGRIFDFEGSMLPGVEDFYRIMGGEQVGCYRWMRSRSPKYFLLRSLQRWRRERKGSLG